jgi:two-component system phosphate regulon response regulator PhoB
MATQILVVEDERDIARVIAYNLKQAGFDVVTAGDGETAMRAAREEQFDLVILDLMLPGISGTEVCRRLKQSPQTARTPIVMLTAKGEELDRVVGFELGADDYVVKPFSVRELILRVQAILRRGSSAEAQEERVQFGVLRFDRAAHRAWVEAAEVALTAREFKLLTTFYDRRGRVLSRDTVLDDVWGTDTDVTERNVDTHVKRLREKLGGAADYVETLRGVGYRFRDHPDEPGA